MKNRDYPFKVEVENYDNEITYVVKYYHLPVIGGGLTTKDAIFEAEENKNAYLDYLDEINEEYPEITINKTTYSGRVTLRISKSLHERANDLANEQGISLNSYISEALNAYVSKAETVKYLQDKVVDQIVAKYEIMSQTTSDNSTKKYIFNFFGSQPSYEGTF